MGGLSCGTKCIKYLLFLFNLVIWLCGAALLALGIWILTAHSSAQYYLNIADMDYGLIKASAVTICVVGGLVFVVAGLGCCGACRENTGCLTGFSVLLVILLVIQLVAVIMAGALHSQIVNGLGKAMNESMVKYYDQHGQELLTESWNFMQMEMKCCGVMKLGPNDWRYTNWWTHNKTAKGDAVPQSCCANLVDPHNYTHPSSKDPQRCYDAAFNKTMTDRSQYAYTVGCEQLLNDWFMSSLGWLIGGVVIVILIQITVLVMACCLKSNIQSSYESI